MKSSIQYNTIQEALFKVGKNQTIITQALVSFEIRHENMHIQTIKQNMHTIFVNKKQSYLNLSMKFITKLKCESN